MRAQSVNVKSNQVKPVKNSILPEISPKRQTAVQMNNKNDGFLSNDEYVDKETYGMSSNYSPDGKSRS